MRNRQNLTTMHAFGLVAVATLVLSAWHPARAESPQTDELSVQPTALRQPDAMPQPPTPTPDSQEHQPATIQGKQPGYWQSPESMVPPQYPHVPDSYYGSRRWRRPFRYLPHYRNYGNRRVPGFRRYRWGW